MNAPLAPERLRRAYVLGLGLSGVAAARLLLARGIEVVASDRRDAAALGLQGLVGAPGATLVLGENAPELPAGLDLVVASPGVALDHPLLAAARRAEVPVVGEIELAFAYLEGTVVAVTGSNGKSTTTAMTGALVAAAGLPVEVCGNIGKPLSAVVDGAPGRVFVVELSSFQLETIARFRPRAAALLNISPDHLDRHGSLAAYLAAKQRVFINQAPEDVAVLNAEEPEVAATETRGRRRMFARGAAVVDGCRLVGERVVEVGPDGESALFAVGDVPLPGPHNLENAMAAALLARAVAVPTAEVAPALRAFRGLPHRVERIAELAGVAYYDDSKGTNVAATARSLEGFADGSVHVILGGRNKGADFAYLREIVTRKARRAYLIGESAAALERSLAGSVELERSETMERALESASATARAGEVVLLSPACASFDQFRDFVDRGERFQAWVRGRAAAPAGAGGR